MGRTLSVVIPALNEEQNIEAVLGTVPRADLAARGWATEVVVVDNGSTDDTAGLARRHGARVVDQPLRGYGNAYRAGLTEASGSIMVTGDADRTYPFDHVPQILELFLRHDLEFLTTNRLLPSNRAAMKPSHSYGNHALSALSRGLFRNGIQDSQSGMWMLSKSLWHRVDVRAGGMAFSQELKNEAFLRSSRCMEIPVEYRPRGGEVKLRAGRDGVRNALQLFAHRIRPYQAPAAAHLTAPARGTTRLDEVSVMRARNAVPDTEAFEFGA